MNILIIAAHPDDEVMGAGGVNNKHLRNKDKVFQLIMDGGREDPIDQRFDTLPFRDFVTKIEQFIKIAKPERVYTHYLGDLNKDHQIVSEAVRIACRPTKCDVKEVYGFDSTMSPLSLKTFNPNYYEALLKEDIDQKINQMKALYPNEMNLPYRTEEGIIITSKYWGMRMGVEYVEPFETILNIG